jgi:hypothetical protein
MTEQTVKSQDKPLSGELNRSSEMFKFKSTPKGYTSVAMPEGIYCVLEHHNGASNDNVIYILYRGASIPKDLVASGNNNYSLSPPQGATAAFDVTFTY